MTLDYVIRSFYPTYRLSDSQPCKDIRLGKFRSDDVTYSFDLSDHYCLRLFRLVKLRLDYVTRSFDLTYCLSDLPLV